MSSGRPYNELLELSKAYKFDPFKQFKTQEQYEEDEEYLNFKAKIEDKLHDRTELEQMENTVCKQRLVKRKNPAFNGLNYLQRNACDNLQNDLSDDIANGGTRCIRKFLHDSGLKSQFINRELEKLKALSDGNANKFLRILLQQHYRTSTKMYTIQEHIILSAIDYVTLIPVLNDIKSALPIKQTDRFNHFTGIIKEI